MAAWQISKFCGLKQENRKMEFTESCSNIVKHDY